MSESGAAENIPTKEEVEERLRQGADWRHFAVCKDEDPELFFPTGTSGPALLQVEQAKAVCRRCPVAEWCLRWALESGQDTGVWGGKSEDERRALKRRGGLRVLRSSGRTATSQTVEMSTSSPAARKDTARPPSTRRSSGSKSTDVQSQLVPNNNRGGQSF